MVPGTHAGLSQRLGGEEGRGQDHLHQQGLSGRISQGQRHPGAEGLWARRRPGAQQGTRAREGFFNRSIVGTFLDESKSQL